MHGASSFLCHIINRGLCQEKYCVHIYVMLGAMCQVSKWFYIAVFTKAVEAIQWTLSLHNNRRLHYNRRLIHTYFLASNCTPFIYSSVLVTPVPPMAILLSDLLKLHFLCDKNQRKSLKGKKLQYTFGRNFPMVEFSFDSAYRLRSDCLFKNRNEIPLY